jgi:hypothetical protein
MVTVGDGERVPVGVWLMDIVLVGILDEVTDGFGDGEIVAVLLTSLDGLPHADIDKISRIVNPRGNLAHTLITAYSLI